MYDGDEGLNDGEPEYLSLLSRCPQERKREEPARESKGGRLQYYVINKVGLGDSIEWSY
jgi:hypothetical protein